MTSEQLEALLDHIEHVTQAKLNEQFERGDLNEGFTVADSRSAIRDVFLGAARDNK